MCSSIVYPGPGFITAKLKGTNQSTNYKYGTWDGYGNIVFGKTQIPHDYILKVYTKYKLKETVHAIMIH